MSPPWTLYKCDQQILEGQPFTTALVAGRSRLTQAWSSRKVLIHKTKKDCKSARRATTPAVTAGLRQEPLAT
jgi:hypothetical protein